ncbi:MAG: hypothetical protein SNJ52_01350 [Verrucomicrobiia bacterium]
MTSLPRPFEHERWEWVFFRILFAVLLLVTCSENWPSFTSMPRPNGLGHFIDFTFLARQELRQPLYGLFVLAMGLYAAGRWIPWALGYATALMVGLGTLSNSQGAIGHHTQLVVMVLLTQWVVYTVHAFRPCVGEGSGRSSCAAASRSALDWSRNVIVSAYVVCAMVKLSRTNGLWVWNSPNLAVQLIKTNEMDFYNRLEKANSFWADQFPQFLVEHPWFARVLFGSGFALELFAFLALLGKRWAFFGGLMMIAMHLSISKIMRLNFETHIWMIVIFLVLPWPCELLAKRLSRWHDLPLLKRRRIAGAKQG